jgi:hypothetical protein
MTTLFLELQNKCNVFDHNMSQCQSTSDLLIYKQSYSLGSIGSLIDK